MSLYNDLTTVLTPYANKINALNESLSAIVSTKTGVYCKTGYIGSAGYATDAKRCQATDFLPEKTLTVSCPDSYLVYLAAYNKSTGKFVGYYTTDNTLATSPINKQRFFDLASIKKTFSGYDWRVTIQTSENTNISSAIYPITVVCIDMDSFAGKCIDKKLSDFCALAQGGMKGTGSALTSTKYVRSSYLVGIESIKMAEGYLATAVNVRFDGTYFRPYILREGLEYVDTGGALNYGHAEVNLRELQEIYPDGVIRLVFHKVDGSDITPSEVDSACSVIVDASEYEADAIVSRYSGRYRISPNYAPSNLVKSHVIATIGADKIQGGLIATPNNGVSAYGQLYVDSTTLKLTSSVTSEAVQLKGVCVWNIAEGSQAATLYGLKAMRRRGANLVRVVCFPTTNAGRGYLEMANKSAYIDTLKQIVYDAMSLDMYVVIDWHLLHVGNPLTYVTEATEFFDEISDEFISCPNVMYEICNEPNGSGGTWANIKTYAETIIPVIRANSPDAVCIVGTPNYSRDLSPIAANPVELANILYTYHWYRTYDYTTELSPYVSALPIFVTEWGAKAATSGSGMSYNVELAQAMLDVLSENKISWMAWSLWQGNSSNGSTFFIEDYQSNKMRTYGGWPYYVFNEFGMLVVDNLVVN